MGAAIDYATGGEAAYTGELPGDVTDNRQMAPFQPGTGAGMAWWESLIAYGATRAIDNRFAPVNVNGDTSPGSFAGSNGRTYSNGQDGPAAPGVSGGVLALLAGAAALVFALVH